MILVSNLSRKLVQKAVVAYVNNNDLIINGEEAESDMSKIIKIYDNVHIASGGNIQEEKVNYLVKVHRKYQ